MKCHVDNLKFENHQHYKFAMRCLSIKEFKSFLKNYTFSTSFDIFFSFFIREGGWILLIDSFNHEYKLISNLAFCSKNIRTIDAGMNEIHKQTRYSN